MPKTLIAALIGLVSGLFVLKASGNEILQSIRQCKEDFWNEFNLVIEEYREKVPQELTKGLDDKDAKRELEAFGRTMVKEGIDLARQKFEVKLDTLPNTAEGLAECEAMLPPKERRRKK